MDNPRPEKVAVVDEVRGRLSAASAAILTEYRGLKVKDLATLRRSLREAGGEYHVYKNTLVRFAARDLGLDSLDALLEGPTAITFIDGDAAAVAKALRDYARTNPNLVVKGGVLGDKVLSAADTTALADLPPREVLLARIAGGLAAPMQQMASLLATLPRNFAYALKALVEKGGADPGAAPESPAAAPESPVDEAPAAVDEAPAAADEAPAEALVSGETDQPEPTAAEVAEATEASGTTEEAPAESIDAGAAAPEPASSTDTPAEALAS
ncbi:MAG: large subunit ribosomal protein, partial [Acidimicrobiaceae bacterium]|nr:large subunit ribosomal protein [Acidimicrobiaceae bacterium]